MLRPSEPLRKAMKSHALGVYSRSTSVTLTPSVNPSSGRLVAETQEQNRVSGHETRIERDEKVVQKENWRICQKGRRGGELVTRGGRETWKICVVHVHNDVKCGYCMHRIAEHVHATPLSPG